MLPIVAKFALSFIIVPINTDSFAHPVNKNIIKIIMPKYIILHIMHLDIHL